MKKRLLIISDLWGGKNPSWLPNYVEVLKLKFDVKYYDSCKLGEVFTVKQDQERIHEQFVNGGINTAVTKLIALETKAINILAFSIGGTIAWEYGIKTGNINSLTCISSTRLRKELNKPTGDLKLFYGEQDAYKPQNEWFTKMNVDYKIIVNKDHDMYRNIDFAKELSNQLLDCI